MKKRIISAMLACAMICGAFWLTGCGTEEGKTDDTENEEATEAAEDFEDTEGAEDAEDAEASEDIVRDRNRREKIKTRGTKIQGIEMRRIETQDERKGRSEVEDVSDFDHRG